ncbi:MAG: hypothetical protein K2Q22_17320, partial [Cytophagales bacterium]|nr:hypothetical protein [Cytophagales bacterium]
AGNNSVQKFDAFGFFVGKYTPTTNSLVSPKGIAVDNLGFVYIIDAGGQGVPFVLKLDGAGNEVASWSYWNTESTFSNPVDIALDPSGNVYVADNGNSQVEKFDANGNLLNIWSGMSSNAIGIDLAYNVYITFNDTIYKFDSTGTSIRKWGGKSLGNGLGNFNGIQGITTDLHGKVYAMDQGGYLCQKFDSIGNFITQWGSNGGNGQLYGPTGIAINSQGYLYVADTKFARVQKFNPDGSYNLQWTLVTPPNGKRQGQEARTSNSDIPIGVAIASNGNVFVLDSTYKTVSVYDSDGGSITTWGQFVFINPKAIALDFSDNVYITEGGTSNQVAVYNSLSKQSMLTIGQGTGTAPGFFNLPWGVVVDGLKNVYVSDYGNNRIQKFDSLGNFIKEWGTLGGGDGNFLGPKGLAIDAFANIYVVDSGNNRIQKFDSSGTFLDKWGTSGEIISPEAIAVNPAGDVLVSDFSTDRIQVFAKQNIDPMIYVSAAKSPIYPGLLGYSYGSTPLSSRKSVQFTVYNFGAPNSTLQLGNGIYYMTITGANASNFVFTPPANPSIAAGDSVTFTIDFTPSSFGSKFAVLEIPTNDPQALSLTLTLTGIGDLIPQTIVGFGPFAKNYIGNPPITLPLVASSGLPITYISSNISVASVSGNVIFIL